MQSAGFITKAGIAKIFNLILVAAVHPSFLQERVPWDDLHGMRYRQPPHRRVILLNYANTPLSKPHTLRKEDFYISVLDSFSGRLIVYLEPN